MSSRRHFVRSLVGASAVLPMFRPTAIRRVLRANDRYGAANPTRQADDEAYWTEIERAFDTDRTLINLNNGGVCPTPTHVLEQMIRDLRFSNESPANHMWAVLEPRIESVRRDLAHDFGCDPEEMAVTRNTSESLEILIQGVDLQPGDEILTTTQNYPRMLTSWDQRMRRYGIVVRRLVWPAPPPSQQFLVDMFRHAITPKTKVIEITHITNLTGQIFPVRDIVTMAREHGIKVFVDGAHAYAHFPFTRDEIDADYYGTSLHKWLLAPIGTGFLYVRRAGIDGIWPLMAAGADQNANIRKFEEIGTHPAANHNAISAAVAFHRGIGSERKIARLRYLRDRWAKRLLAESDRVRIPTQIDTPYSGAICLVMIDGLDPGQLAGWLLDRKGIVTTPIGNAEFTGLRVTPNVYTTPDEIDTFGDAMVEAIRKGIG
ncbi:MAG: aminotransferase class V-fold PLP-dependent enzyme [Gemmatimonadales bacterium]